MKKIFYALTCTVILFVFCQVSDAQITVTNRTNTTPSLSATYSTLALAITDLNAITSISGPVTIKVTTSSYTETAPSGGYQIDLASLSNPGVYPITIDGDHKATITAFTPQPTGETYDAIFKIVGADLVTIQKFTMQENSGNTVTTSGSNTMTEWGVALLRRASGNDGAQNNSIIDNDISLDRTYPNSIGIYSNVRHAPTTPTTTADITNITGSNFGNHIYYNRISYVSLGITFIGCNSDALMDDSNDIGGTSSSTGNTLTHWGGNSLVTISYAGNSNSEYYGILMRNQKNNNISYNSLTSSTSLSGSTAAAVRGIHNGTITGTVTNTFNTTIDYNTVTITDNLPNATGTTGRLDGIVCTEKLGTLSISNNTITGLAVATSASNKFMRCISNSASAANVFIDYNTISANTSTASANPGSFTGIEQTGIISTQVEIVGNLIGDASTSTPAITYSVTPNGTGMITGINNSPSTPTGASLVNIDYNSFYGFVAPGSASNRHIYISLEHTTNIASDMHVDYNEFANIDAHTSNDVYFIQGIGAMATSAGASLSVSHNYITGSFTKSLSGGDVYLYNGRGTSGTGNTMVEDGNDFSNISLTGTTVMHGWFNNEGVSAVGPQKSIINNVFDSWTCGTTGIYTSSVIYCDWASGNSEISGNSISNITIYGSVNGILDGSNTSATVNIDGNKIVDLSSGSGTLALINISGTGSRTVSNSSLKTASNTGTTITGITWPTTLGTGNNLNCWYNTIYLQGVTGVSSSCLTVRGSTNGAQNPSIVRNNLLINTSTQTGSAVVSAISTLTTGITNYSSTSNNNIFYVGTIGTYRVIYYDQANSSNNQPTLGNFQTYSSAEGLSDSFMPDFVSTSDLHLLSGSSVNCKIFNHGNNQGILLAKDWAIDNNPRLTVSPYITDIGADEAIITNIWTGAANTSAWNNNSNWMYSPYPNNAEVNVYIPKVTSPRVQPINTGTYQVDDVFLQTGQSMVLLTNRGTLQIAGEIQGDDGSFSNRNGTATVGSIEMNGTCGTQTIQGQIFYPSTVSVPSGDVNNFTASNNVDVKTTGTELNIFGQLGFGTGTSNLTITSSPANFTDKGITLKSGEFSTGVFTTASVGFIDPMATPVNSIVGNVTVERYINTGTSGSQHNPSWQLLAIPTVGQSIRESWQENGSIPTGYGTWLVAPATATGYDGVRSTYSVKYYDPGVGNFVPVTNTTTTGYDQRGYFVFVHGDRNIQIFGNPGNPTALRTKGTLFQPGNPPPTSTAANANDVVQIGNPYASTIDLRNVTFSGFNNDVTIWDPISPGTLGYGDYLTLSAANDYEPAYGMGISPTAYYPVGRDCYDLQSGQAFYVTASANGGTVTFDENCKITGSRLVTRQNASSPNKKFFRAQLFSNTGVCDGNATVFSNIYLNKINEDDSRKMLNPGENFIVRRNNLNLAVEARSEVKQGDTIFYTFTNMRELTYQLKFLPKNFDHNLLQATLVDNYLGSRIGLSVEDTSNVFFTVDKNSASFTDRFYVVFTDKNSDLFSTTGKNVFSIYPNPVENGELNLHFFNLAAGKYQLDLIDNSARIILSKPLLVAEKQSSQPVKLDAQIAAGNYRVCLTSKDGKKFQQQIHID